MKRQIAREIAKERIGILLTTALTETQAKIANQQAYLAKKIAMRLRIRLDYEVRQLFCKKCKQFIIPGRDSRIRIGRSNTRGIRITCLRCGHIYHKVLGQPVSNSGVVA